MVGEDCGGPSKKPRIDNGTYLLEIVYLKEQVRKLQEKVQDDEKEKKEQEKENEQLKKQLKEVQDEKKEADKAMEELRGMVECPVCLSVPRHGRPVPVCSNGHFVCRTCRDRIREDAGEQEPKCPSCMATPPPCSPPGWSRS